MRPAGEPAGRIYELSWLTSWQFRLSGRVVVARVAVVARRRLADDQFAWRCAAREHQSLLGALLAVVVMRRGLVQLKNHQAEHVDLRVPGEGSCGPTVDAQSDDLRRTCDERLVEPVASCARLGLNGRQRDVDATDHDHDGRCAGVRAVAPFARVGLIPVDLGDPEVDRAVEPEVTVGAFGRISIRITIDHAVVAGAEASDDCLADEFAAACIGGCRNHEQSREQRERDGQDPRLA